MNKNVQMIIGAVFLAAVAIGLVLYLKWDREQGIACRHCGKKVEYTVRMFHEMSCEKNPGRDTKKK